MNGKDFTITTFSDVYEIHHYETGEPLERLSFYVVATAPNGERFTHVHHFSTEDFSRDEAVGRVEALASRIRQAAQAGTWAGPEDSPHWRETYPAYGSRAYQDDEFETVERERFDAIQAEFR